MVLIWPWTSDKDVEASWVQVKVKCRYLEICASHLLWCRCSPEQSDKRQHLRACWAQPRWASSQTPASIRLTPTQSWKGWTVISPLISFSLCFSLLVPWQGEVDSGSVLLFETNRLEDIWSGLSEMPLCIHVRKTKWNFPLIQKLKAARLYFSKRN